MCVYSILAMAKADPYVFDGGNARWTPPQQQPAVGDSPPMPALPSPCEAAKHVVQSAMEKVMLGDKPHAEMMAYARRSIDLIDTGTSAIEWVLMIALLFAAIVLVWLAFFYWRRGTRIEKV